MLKNHTPLFKFTTTSVFVVFLFLHICTTSSSPMATLQSHLQFSLSHAPKLIHLKNPRSFSFSKKILLPRKLFPAKRFNGLLNSRLISYSIAGSSISSSAAGIEKSASSEIVNERTSFDINLAVILAGFAFEAYTTPPVISFFPLISATLAFLWWNVGKVVFLIRGFSGLSFGKISSEQEKRYINCCTSLSMWSDCSMHLRIMR